MSQSATEKTFELIVNAAAKGIRCPMNEPIGPLYHAAVMTLIQQEKIKVEISGHNYRTVTVLVGSQAGKMTAPDPAGNAVWKVNGQIAGGIASKRLGRPGPSAPRCIHGLRDLKEGG